MLSDEQQRIAREGFVEGLNGQEVAAKSGLSYFRLRKFWISEFGQEKVDQRGKENLTKFVDEDFEKIQQALLGEFERTLSVKNLGVKYKISPNRVKKLWNETFGDDAVKQRANRARAANAGKDKGEKVEKPAKDLSNQVKCPVCGKSCTGNRGLNTHFNHSKDRDHIEYQRKVEEAKWAGLWEGIDYVVCRICEFKSTTLARHLKPTHGIDAEEYKKRYPGSKIRCNNLTVTRAKSFKKMHETLDMKGKRKIFQCTGCTQSFEGSLYLVPGCHLILCGTCKIQKLDAERLEYEKQWVGKSEPEEFVTCQLCGHKSVNLTSHIRSIHPECEGKYLKEFPNNQIMANCCETRSTDHWEKKYTKEQLLKYADEKGDIIVCDAEVGLDCSRTPLMRLCGEYGLKTRNNRAFQKSVMEHVKQVLLGAEYEWEYRDNRIRSLKNSRYLLSFDGYFPNHNLIVEAHGKQHFERIPYFHKEEGTFEYQQRLDRHKLESAIELGYTYLEIRYDEPYTDLRHLRTRLRDLQVEIRAVEPEDEEVNFLEVVGD